MEGQFGGIYRAQGRTRKDTKIKWEDHEKTLRRRGRTLQRNSGKTQGDTGKTL